VQGVAYWFKWHGDEGNEQEALGITTIPGDQQTHTEFGLSVGVCWVSNLRPVSKCPLGSWFKFCKHPFPSGNEAAPWSPLSPVTAAYTHLGESSTTNERQIYVGVVENNKDALSLHFSVLVRLARDREAIVPGDSGLDTFMEHNVLYFNYHSTSFHLHHSQ